jgi:hypothetical protein
MAFLAQPLALLALGTLALPVLLYLLRRPRQVVRVGRLRPLETQRTPPALRWQPRWLLLALRCALLAVLALLLADPFLRPARPGVVRWLLRAPGTTLGPAEQAAWEAARREGWQPRLLAPGFGAYDEAMPADPAADFFSLLGELDARVAAGSKAMVFAPTEARHFPGMRPVLSRLAVTWHPVAGGPDAVATGTDATFVVIAPPERAVIAGRVRAALTAIGAREDADRAQWVVHLGDGSLDAALRRRVEDGAIMVTEANASDPVLPGARAFVVAGERVPVLRRVAAAAGAVRLRDETGDPWLTEVRIGRGRHWQLAFRLDPEWTDWTLRAAFPRWWAEQIAAQNSGGVALEATQVTPTLAPAALPSDPPLQPAPMRMAAWFWLLAAAIFLAERIMSWREARRAGP